jgi:hypothetical protein
MFLVISPNIVNVSAEGLGEQEIKDTIQTYFALRYAELKTLNPADYSDILDLSDPVTTAWRQMEKSRSEIKKRIAKTFEENILDVQFSLDYTAVNRSGTKAVVMLLESNEIVYSSVPSEPAKMADLPHEITLKIKDGRWVIQQDRYQDELTYVLVHASLEEAFENIKINHDILTKGEESILSPDNSVPVSNLAPYSYDNSAAAMYSNTYWHTTGWIPSVVINTSGWQSAWPTRYKSYSVDCTNFVSQAIFQGTSATNSDANYLYPAVNYNTSWYYKFTPTLDGSLPWVNVGGLYNFLLSNQNGALGRGPGGIRIDICGTRAGQPIFMKLSDGWAHAVVVGAVNSCTDIRVNSHSSSYYRTPISTYSAYALFPVYIRSYYK